jgi:Flp pilus assembly protein TadB
VTTVTGQPREVEREAPPVGEEIHLPGPSFLPVACAIGITLILVGTTINWLVSIIGGVIFVITVVMWVRDTARDISELPEEHTH